MVTSIPLLNKITVCNNHNFRGRSNALKTVKVMATKCCVYDCHRQKLRNSDTVAAGKREEQDIFRGEGRFVLKKSLALCTTKWPFSWFHYFSEGVDKRSFQGLALAPSYWRRHCKVPLQSAKWGLGETMTNDKKIKTNYIVLVTYLYLYMVSIYGKFYKQ